MKNLIKATYFFKETELQKPGQSSKASDWKRKERWKSLHSNSANKISKKWAILQWWVSCYIEKNGNLTQKRPQF